MLIWFTGLILANACYNSFGFKRLPILDLLNQAGYVLVFVLASWLCEVPQLNTPAIIFGAIFAMQSHLFGQLMDFDEDKAAGRKSTAITMGYRPAKVLHRNHVVPSRHRLHELSQLTGGPIHGNRSNVFLLATCASVHVDIACGL